MPTCCILNCGARKNKHQPNLTLHRFPKNEGMRKKWLEAIGGEEKINPRHKRWNVCSLHFHESCFNTTLEVVRLRENSVPTIFHELKANAMNICAKVNPTTSDAKLICLPESSILQEMGNIIPNISTGPTPLTLLKEPHQGVKCLQKETKKPDRTSMDFDNVNANDDHCYASRNKKDRPPYSIKAANSSTDQAKNVPGVSQSAEINEPEGIEHDDQIDEAIPLFSWQAPSQINVEEEVREEVPAITATNEESEVNVDLQKKYNKDPIAIDGLEDANDIAEEQTAEVKVEEAEYTSKNHTGYSCDYCKGEIIGFRYRCIECENYDLCRACESRLVHPQHFVLRIPRPTPFNEVKSMVEAIRERIEMLTEEIKDANDSMALDDIKKEMTFEEVQLDPFEELAATDTVPDVPAGGTDIQTQVPQACGESKDEQEDKGSVTALAARTLKEWDVESDTTEITTSEYQGCVDDTNKKRKRKHTFSDESRDTHTMNLDEMRRKYADLTWRDELDLRVGTDDIRRIENIEVEWLDESILESEDTQNRNEKIGIENEDIGRSDEEVVKNPSDLEKISVQKQALQKAQKVQKSKVEEMVLKNLLQSKRKRVNILSKSNKLNS